MGALGARAVLEISWRGAQLDRVLDEGHARLVGAVVERLLARGWTAEVEVSYSAFGERGSIDVLAWHPATATPAVFEVKTELGTVEGLLRPLDAKVRLGPGIARDQFGWRAARVARIAVFPDETTVRRQLARHRVVMDQALPSSTVEVRRWLDAPVVELRACWFPPAISHDPALMRNPSAVQRVSTQRRRS